MKHQLFALIIMSSSMGCGGGTENTASHLMQTPKIEGDLAAKCVPGKIDDKPLIVALSSSDKLAMESRVKSGPLVVTYKECNIALLSRCSASGAYRYSGGTLKKDSVAAKNDDELFAKIPVGAYSFAGKVKSYGAISVATATVGRFETDAPTPTKGDLTGDCAGATHWVTGITVGAYRMAAGSDAEVAAKAALFGAEGGASSSASRESLSQDGNGQACEKASASDARPPQDCGGLLRLELQAIP